MSVDAITEYLKPGRRAHLIGIGGVSMSALGEVLHGKGLTVTGSDMQAGAVLDALKARGIKVSAGHFAGNIAGADFIIRTAAAKDDNVEVLAARRGGLPVFERAQVWGALMREYDDSLCVAGTHGKTTTTSMAVQIALEAGFDPTVMIGGNFPLIGSGHRVGGGGLIIMEACEYCDSFLNFVPTVAAILNIEADHLDYFSGLEAIIESFSCFAGLTPPNGSVIVNYDDNAAMKAVSNLTRELITFGINGGNVSVADLSFDKAFASFSMTLDGKAATRVRLRVPGRYNVSNALAAGASMFALGAGPDAIGRALSGFEGAGRRFEYKGTVNNARVYDDYAHHPSEITSVLSAVGTLREKRLICVFQPHTYTRTHALLGDFAKALALADLVVLPDIYAAREANTVGISSKDLADLIPGAVYMPGFADIADYLKDKVREGDIVITVGAGDVHQVAELLCG